jgi:predicted MFS family arabinose efflux permease
MREFLYVYLGDVYRLDRQDIAGVLTAAGVMAFLASLATGPLADRVGPGPVLLSLLASAAAGFVAIGTAPAGLAGIALGIALVNTATRSSLPLTRNAVFLGTALASTLVAFSNTVNNVGQVLSPIVSATLYEELKGTQLGPLPGHAAPFAASAALVAATALLYPLAAGGKRTKEEQEA